MKKLIILISMYIALNANTVYKSHMDKKVFLGASPTSYTINLSTIYYYEGYKDFIKELNTDKDVFVFEYGDNKKNLVAKVLFGVFVSYKDALKAVNKLPERLRNNKPYINKIGKFQELYKTYHNKKSTIKYPVPKKDIKKMIAQKKKEEKKLEKKGEFEEEYIDENTNIKSTNFIKSLKYVVETSSVILEQDELVKVAKSEINIAMSNFLPKLDYSQSTSDISNAFDSTGSTLQTDAKSKDITASWNIFNGMKDYYSYQAKNIQFRSVILTRQDIVDTYILDFISAFAEVLKQKEIYDLGTRDIQAYEKYMIKKKLQKKYGMTSMSKTSAIDKKYITAQIKYLENNDKKYMDSIFELQKFIKVNKDTNLGKDFQKIKVNASLFNIKDISNITLAKHPKILKARNEIKLAQTNVKQEYNKYSPTLALTAKKSEAIATYTDREEETHDTTIKFETKINLYNGGKDYYTIKKNKNTQKQKQIDYETVKKKALYNVKSNLYTYQIFEKKLMLVKQLLISADQAYVSAEFDYSYAKVDEDALLGAMESLYSAEKQNIDLRYDIINAKYKLLFEMGVLQDTLKELVKNKK
ncbi:MAG: hypothetical protein DRG78_18265 [Epsilonproteobacteria bacterium]|nr:MAG: hypothetical protein DRG78_18265 [Campylobacterota bacterium]